MTDWLTSVLADGEHSARLRSDLIYFAEHALKLRPKTGALVPFVFNQAQLRLHEAIEKQKAETGRVRVVCLKARQLGISTYIAARLFHKTIMNPGLRTVIVGHERRASSNLFQIVKRFYDHLPDDLKPVVGTSNADELIFEKLDSGYLVTVATNEGAGRSATAQCLHASETAFWPDLEMQMASLLQTVPDGAGTEIILESTACGYNQFHALWRKAEVGASEFTPCFIPWSIDPDYRREPAEGFTLDADEKKLVEVYGLDDAQINWRRSKLGQLGSGQWFSQEFPLTASEAFVSSSFDLFIKPELVLRSRQEKIEEDHGQIVIGVDPAGAGLSGDRSCIAWRRGRRITKVESRRGMTTMEIAGWVGKIIREDKPRRVNIDVTGLGVGVFDRLIELGHSRSLVQPVNFSGKPVEPPELDETGKPAGGPANRRSEMWLNLKKTLEGGRFGLPDSDELQADLVSVGDKYNSSGQLLLEAKADMKKRGVPSPDLGESVALCFADPDGFVRDANFRRDLSREFGGLYV